MNKNLIRGIALACFIATFIIIIAFVMSPSSSNPPSRQAQPSGVGTECIVASDDFDDIYLAIDKVAFDKWVDAVVANDKMGVRDLLYSGELFYVPSGTEVLILDISWGSHKVRILEGDKYGKTGWLPSEYLK